MNIEKKVCKSDFTVLNMLFLKGDIIYISGSIYMMNGTFDYARKYFHNNRTYLGMTSDKYYYQHINDRTDKYSED